MTPNEKQLRAAMAEQARIAGVLAEKKTEFEAGNAALKQRRIDHNKLAAGVALGETHDVAASQRALDKAMSYVSNLGAVLDGVEERFAEANATLATTTEQYREFLQGADNQFANQIRDEFRRLVQDTFRPGLLRLLARTANRSAGMYSTLVQLKITGLLGEDLLILQTSKVEPGLEPGSLKVRHCFPFEDDPKLMELANQDDGGAQLLRQAVLQVAKFKKPDVTDGGLKQFAVVGGGTRAAA